MRSSCTLYVLVAVCFVLPLEGSQSDGVGDETTSPGWVSHADSHTPRTEGAGITYDGKFYVVAGFARDVISTTLSEVFDPDTDTWSLRAPIPRAVSHVGAALVDGRIWIVGGFEGDHPGPSVEIVQIYDIADDTWSSGPPLPTPRASGTLALRGRLLHYVGGLLPDRDTDVGDHFVLHVDQWENGWKPAAPLPHPRNHLSSAVFRGRLFVIGGQFGHDGGRTLSPLVHEYDSTTDTWARRADLPLARSHAEASTFVYDDRIIVAGGVGPGPIQTASIDLITAYDPSTDTWADIGKLPEKLLGLEAGILAGRFFAANGSIGLSGNAQATTWSIPYSNLDVESVSTSTARQEEPPQGFSLAPNYPNPFNRYTIIRYSLPRQEQAILSVYNLLGEVVAVLVNERKPAGTHHVTFKSGHLPSGSYLCEMRAGGFRYVRRMSLVR